MKIIKRSLSVVFMLLFTLTVASVGYSQCGISNLSITSSECNTNQLVDLEINFDFMDVGSQGFTILGNGTNYGNFEYSSLPITLPNISANCETEYEFIIRDIQDPTCAVFTEYGTICCDGECNITILDIFVSECIDNNFGLSIVTNPESEGELVNVLINGTVLLQLELDGIGFVLEELNLSEGGINEVTICSATDPGCCDLITFLNPCKCGTSNITAQIIECNDIDSSYFAIIDFEYAATSDSFQMGYSDAGDNNFLGVFAYADLPVTAGPIFWSDNERELLIVDKEDFFCFNSAYIGVVNDCSIDCQIFNVFAESYECEEGQYYIDVEFDTEDIQGSTFDVIVDGINYGTFIYGENLYTVGPIIQNCESAPVVIIQDTNLESCKDFFNFDEPICCDPPCAFSVFEANAICTDSDEVVITFEYDNPNTSDNDQFFITFGDLVYGPFNGPSGAGEFSIPTPENGTYSLTITVEGNSECLEMTSVSIDCIMTPECAISDVFAEAHECVDGTFLVDIEFDASAVSDSFEIRGNGQSYGIFSYGESFYTVGPLLGDCETIYEFVIIDQEDSDCQAATSFDEPICCSTCEYGEMQIGLTDCNEDGYIVIIDFTFEDSNDSFLLSYLLNSFTVAYSDLPLEISELPYATDFDIIATNIGEESCETSASSYLETCLDAVTEDEFNSIQVAQSTNQITINNPTQFDFDIILSSISGQLLHKGTSRANEEYLIRNDALSNGVYLISFMNNGTLNSKKIVILASSK